MAAGSYESSMITTRKRERKKEQKDTFKNND
jgi:hypothetical protein